MKSAGSNLPRSHVALLSLVWVLPLFLSILAARLRASLLTVTFLCCLFWDLVLIVSPLETDPMKGPRG